MARALRIQYEGAHYHIFSKGNRDECIFGKDEDKDYFVYLLSQGQGKYRIEIYAYCVLGTHYHMLIQTLEPNLADFMHYLGSSYGSYLAKNNWRGHIFWGRYNSILVDHEKYLMVLSRYIHFNPVEAGIVELPERYPWSSYVYYLNGSKPPSWLSTSWLVDSFGDNIVEARENYRQCMLDGLKEGIAYPSQDLIGQAILGGKEFVERIAAKVDNHSVLKEIQRLNCSLKGLTIDEIYQGVCEFYRLGSLRTCEFEDREKLFTARQIFIFLTREHTTFTNVEIAGIIGDIGPAAVSIQYSRMCRKCKENTQYEESLSAELSAIIKRLKE